LGIIKNNNTTKQPIDKNHEVSELNVFLFNCFLNLKIQKNPQDAEIEVYVLREKASRKA
jgi:hypothetical protein